MSDLLRKTRPDIVCLDYQLPDSDGITLLREVRSSHPDVSVIMITGRSDRETILQANQLHAKGYVLKPFQPQKVVDVIDKLLQGAPK